MMKKILHDDQAVLTSTTASRLPPWPLRMAVAATVLALGAYSPADVQALGLGRITVLSALGEPLRAEIDIPQITAEEASSLKATIAGPAAFRTAGVEYNAALASATVTLQRRPDGRSYLRVTSDKTVNEPFVDMILEANWSSGRIVRDYTLLFDPSGMRQSAPAAPVAAQVPAQASAEAPAARPTTTPRSAPPAAIAPAPAPGKGARQTAAGPAKSPAQPAKPSQRESTDGKQIKVMPGDTAGRIAAAHKPNEVSLDQMLVALLRTNPNAFIDGNVNRIKAGAVIDLPSAEQASAVTTDEARKTLVAQSASFNDYRRKLAEAAPARQVAGADRKTSGSLQASVEDKKPAATSPDKLTLSKGAVKGKSPEAQIAEARQTKEAAERVAELSKNINELSRLQDKTSTVAGASAPASAASGARGPALPVGVAASAAKPAATPVATASAATATAKLTPSATTTTATVAVTAGTATTASRATPAASAASSTAPVPATAGASASAASAPTPAPAMLPSVPAATGTPTVTASAAVSAASSPASKPKPLVAAKPAAPEPSLVDELLENPVIPAVAGGLIALLAGFGFYRARQRKKSSQIDSSFLESRLQPDSFFGSSGGQRVDTADATPTGSSLAYSPSQLDAAGDVDPVAEADVYLAYGRDLQAEEILKEALKLNPSRIAIHGKLLEIYAKRRDTRAFEMLANDAFKLSEGVGSEWDQICDFGRELEPDNPLYQPGGHPIDKAETAMAAKPVSPAFASSTIPVAPHPDLAGPSSMPVDLDLGDLELSYTSPAPLAFDANRPAVTTAPPHADSGLSWDAISTAGEGSGAGIDIATAQIEPVIDITEPEPPVSHASGAPAVEAGGSGMIEFDLGALSLDLDPSVPKPDSDAAPPHLTDHDQDPMETKLALAQEFHVIGDTDGARALVEEVVASSTGPLKAKAQRFLAELG